MSLGKHILILIILFIGAFNIFASDNGYIIYSIGNEEANCKFEDNRVNCIYKDSDGFIWVGTGSTVERINGKYTSLYTFAEKQDMDPILKQQLLAFILGGSFLSTITGFVTLKYTKKQAEAKALSSVQDVYQELIADLRADKEAMKKDKVESETRWTIRIEKLESNQQSQDKKIADNEKEIADLKRFKCINLSCNNRKQ